jgi:hypothetical protein
MVEVRGVELIDAPSQDVLSEESGTTGVDWKGQKKPRICWELLGVQPFGVDTLYPGRGGMVVDMGSYAWSFASICRCPPRGWH